MSQKQVLEINNIPPLIRVNNLINGRLPPAIFIAAPKGPQSCDSCGQNEIKLYVEDYILLSILPVDLQVTVRREMRFVMYRRYEEDLRSWRSVYTPGSKPGNVTRTEEDQILEHMSSIWPTLSDEHRKTLDDEGATCWPERKPDFKGEF